MRWNEGTDLAFRLGGAIANFQAIAAAMGEEIFCKISGKELLLQFSWYPDNVGRLSLNQITIDKLNDFIWLRIITLVAEKSGIPLSWPYADEEEN